MEAGEARDLGRLGAVLLRGGTTRVHEVHGGVAGRVFGALGPLAAPVRVVHDGISAGSYAAVRVGLGLGAVAVGWAAAHRADGRPLQERPRLRTALTVANGTHGDLLAEHAPTLAYRMTVRLDGRDVDLADLRTAYPAATGRVVVLLHGLTEDERAWGYRSGEHYGARLERDLGMTPVLVRYPTGRHVSDNGRALADLLDRLVQAWPVPVDDLVLVGHSMGGLVARSALHQAGGGTDEAAPWTRLVRDTVTLGSPHAGAPLERAAHRATRALRRLPETRPLAVLLASRAAGIKDLGHGALLAEDWQGRDLDAPYDRRPTHVPLLDGARHFVVLATLSRDAEAPLGRLLGDLLVTPRSALGDGRLAFPPDHVHHVGGVHHFALLDDDRVYGQILTWLRERPRPEVDPAC